MSRQNRFYLTGEHSSFKVRDINTKSCQQYLKMVFVLEAFRLIPLYSFGCISIEIGGILFGVFNRQFKLIFFKSLFNFRFVHL